MAMCTLDIICETAMGRSLNAQNDGKHPYIESMNKFVVTAMERISVPLYWNFTLYKMMDRGKEAMKYLKVLQDFSSETITQRKSLNNGAENSEKKKKKAFLDLLIEMNKNGDLSDSEIQSQTDTFMFAGHDTTATALTWLLYIFGSHPEIQKKCQEEVDSVAGDEPLDAERCNALHYLDMVIKEAMRFLPSVPMISRKLVKPMKLDDSITIPAGVSCNVFIYSLHHNGELYPDPYRFDPDRFLPENVAKRHPFAYVPFSAGLRNCIGQRFAQQEEKIIAAHILRNFNVKAHQTDEEIFNENEFAIVNKPGKGVWVTFEERQKDEY